MANLSYLLPEASTDGSFCREPKIDSANKAMLKNKSVEQDIDRATTIS